MLVAFVQDQENTTAVVTVASLEMATFALDQLLRLSQG